MVLGTGSPQATAVGAFEQVFFDRARQCRRAHIVRGLDLDHLLEERSRKVEIFRRGQRARSGLCRQRRRCNDKSHCTGQ